MPDSHSHSAPRGRVSRRPVSRAMATISRQAAPYLTPSAVNTGAPASTEETATLPPTQTMAAAPAATPIAAPPGGDAGGAAGAGVGAGRVAAGRVRAAAAGRVRAVAASGETAVMGASGARRPGTS